MTKPDVSNPSEKSHPAGTDADANGDHLGASAYENAGPGTPGNVGGATDGANAEPSDATKLKAEQATVSSPASGSVA